MNFGEKMRYLRQKERKTLQEQSEVFGVKLNTVFRWEHNQTRPNMPMLESIAEYYDVSVAWLTGDDKEENTKGKYSDNYTEGDIEQQIIKIINQLPDKDKYKILGYVERAYMDIY